MTKDMVWPILRDETYNSRWIYWPELSVEGPLIEGYALLIRMLMGWLQEEVSMDIEHRNSELNLPECYLAMQVRRSDKIEMNDAGAVFIDFQKYIDATAHKMDIETVFVVADDGAVVDDLSNYAERRWIHRIERGRAGYRHAEFLDMDPAERKRRIVKLLADFLVCTNAEFFVGTHSSNFSRSVGAWRRDRYCLSLDMAWRNY